MCFDLCAGDLTQNCLCEENGLFARITEGWDIDDLDIPDREDTRQVQRANAGEFDQARRMAADNMAPISAILNLAIQLSTMDGVQLKKLKKYFQKVERLQQTERSERSILLDESSPILATPNISSAGQSLTLPQPENSIKLVAHSVIEVQDDIPKVSTHQIASAMASSCLPVPAVSWDKTIFNVNRKPPTRIPRDRQATHTNSCDNEKNTMEHGRVRRSFSTLRSAFYRKFMKSKCFDADLIDELIRPSPFKITPLSSMA